MNEWSHSKKIISLTLNFLTLLNITSIVIYSIYIYYITWYDIYVLVQQIGLIIFIIIIIY